nr:7403_t:CDS:2 [Entrophospora candida]
MGATLTNHTYQDFHNYWACSPVREKVLNWSATKYCTKKLLLLTMSPQSSMAVTLEQSHQRIPGKFHPYYFDAKYVEFSEPTCSPYELGFNSRKQNDDNLEDFNSNRNTNLIYNQLFDNNCCLDSPPQTLQQPQLLQSSLQTNTSMTAPEIQITPDDGNDCDNISTTANYIMVRKMDYEQNTSQEASSSKGKRRKAQYCDLEGQDDVVCDYEINNASIISDKVTIPDI